MSESAPRRPGISCGPYPERASARELAFDRVIRGLAPGFVWGPSPRRLSRFVREVDEAGCPLLDAGEEDLLAEARALRSVLQARGLRDRLLVRCFALVRETARRTLGTPHHGVQLQGGYLMARGRIAEMATGEGKTLTATLPACAAALAGIPVHVISVNDYLVTRDAEAMAPLYETLGLSVGAVRGSDSDPESRRRAYGCDVTYVTGQQVAFDYLRDRLARKGRGGPLSLRFRRLRGGSPRAGGSLLLRGLCFAVVDEADSVLIDEARTPLILSGPAPGADARSASLREAALALARELQEGPDFRVREQERRVELTASGRDRLAAVDAFQGPRQGEEWVTRALAALHVYRRDRDYLVRDGGVEIIDAGTGRVLPGRAWEAGLHQLGERKEGCEPTPERVTLARISTQRFFRRYHRLAGMTGTAREVARELRAVYGLATRAIPTHRPARRRSLGTRVLGSAEAKWDAVVERVAEIHATGQPVLVGTCSVEDSEGLGRRLEQEGLAHQLLNARQDAEEAAIVARAGERGQIMVATNMAGRGTDIRLGPGVAELGGLHVILTERGEARRLDRQLAGRCARQGEPGSVESILCLEDGPAGRHVPERLSRALAALPGGNTVSALLGIPVIVYAQLADEVSGVRTRRAVMDMEDELEDLLAFSGQGE